MRGKFRALLRRKCPDLGIPDAVWRTPWILHVTAWGNGEQAVLDYLARYVFRIALTNQQFSFCRGRRFGDVKSAKPKVQNLPGQPR